MKKQAKPTVPASPSCTFETCTQPARENGWCAQHDNAARLLSMVQRYGCPEYIEGALIVRRGFGNWLAYCERVTPEHARGIEAILKARYSDVKRGKVT